MYTHPTRATWNTDKPRSGPVGRPGPRVSSLPQARGRHTAYGLTPSPRRETGYSAYARPTPPAAQRGPLQRVSGLGVDVHDHRQRCNSEKHPRVSQLFAARSHHPPLEGFMGRSNNMASVCLESPRQPASAAQGQVDGPCRAAAGGLEAFRSSLTAFGQVSRPRRRVSTRRPETLRRPSRWLRHVARRYPRRS